MAAQKNPGFDLYWLAVALNKVQSFPDVITQWPQDMILNVEAQAIKKKFAELSTRTLAKITKK